ncbi:MgtC/SapB family protein [Phenylobacterium sp.]|uniref:MgtC/SapB family protein n=1 Tax=Phenylobacterium sp. TaxID=1871053 RepID=UPI0027314CD9|nr:MgtC/SapB family protein [Phenylobacterium sp.]MDP1874324.1 MgtC/SapB family protein [Phenylobacterium sp.]MDP3489317.1 MgtC/SapB family protein [Phenylobacterium sp.]
MEWLTGYVVPVLGAVLAGGLIGLEREYRGRPAGFRTHILVALTSSLLMLAAIHQLEWMGDVEGDVIRIDPTRMAHGILTGIGFLCGGVIFRHGLSVHGLTTAASLWITSALGTLYGVGFYGLAIGGTAVTLLVLGVLRWADRRIPQLRILDVKVRYRRAEAMTEEEFRTLVGEFNLEAGAVSERLWSGENEDQARVEHRATLRGTGAANMARLAEHLREDRRVVEYSLSPRKD